MSGHSAAPVSVSSSVTSISGGLHAGSWHSRRASMTTSGCTAPPLLAMPRVPVVTRPHGARATHDGSEIRWVVWHGIWEFERAEALADTIGTVNDEAARRLRSSSETDVGARQPGLPHRNASGRPPPCATCSGRESRTEQTLRAGGTSGETAAAAVSATVSLIWYLPSNSMNVRFTQTAFQSLPDFSLNVSQNRFFTASNSVLNGTICPRSPTWARRECPMPCSDGRHNG